MRKTMIAIAIGLTALATAACGDNTGGTDTESLAPLESTAPLESIDPMESVDPMESPSDMLESPASS